MNLTDNLVSMSADIAMLRSAFGNALKVGPVEVIDAEKGYRAKWGERNGKPFLSPWLPHPESGKSSVPLKKGDIIGVINPSGDMRQAAIFRAGYSGLRQSPNDDMDANVFEDAGVRVSIANGVLKIVGDFVVEGNADFNEGHLKAHGKNVGHDHKHRDVEPGPSLTGVPD